MRIVAGLTTIGCTRRMLEDKRTVLVFVTFGANGFVVSGTKLS